MQLTVFLLNPAILTRLHSGWDGFKVLYYYSSVLCFYVNNEYFTSHVFSQLFSLSLAQVSGYLIPEEVCSIEL